MRLRFPRLLLAAGWLALRGLASTNCCSVLFSPPPTPQPEWETSPWLISHRPPRGHPDRARAARLSTYERRHWRELEVRIRDEAGGVGSR